MNRRRLTALALVAALVGGVGSAQIAGADPVVGSDAVDDLGGLDLHSVGQRYWACLAVDGVDLGLCLDNPLPDTSQLPSVPELLGGLG